MQIIDLLDHGLNVAPSQGYVADSTNRFSHQQVLELSKRVANGLLEAGVSKGSRVAFYSPNCAVAFVALLAVLRIGAVWQPVHSKNPLPENIGFLVENQCEFLFYHSSMSQEAGEIAKTVPSLRGMRCFDQADEQGSDLIAWAQGHSPDYEGQGASDDDLCWIKSTGGTTGRPKSVQISSKNAQALFATFQICMPLEGGHVNLVAPPMTHGAGNIALACLAGGGSLYIMEKVDVDAIIDVIPEHKITTLFLPPTVIYSMLSNPRVRQGNYSTLKYFLYSAAPMSDKKLKEAVDVFGPVMCQAWGQTEAPLICTFMSPRDYVDAPAARFKSCGKATPLTRVEVMGVDGRLLGVGQVGELVVRGDLVMKGYLNRPEENESVSRFGWHHTGDVGYRDENGYFYIVDRNKDMIITGGFNVYPSEIEQVLWRHPAVLDCAVIGVPDEKWGEAVKAVVELKEGARVSEEELRLHCRNELAGVKTPKSIEFWPQLPRSPLGKVLKKDIREKYWQGQERRV